MAANNSGWQSHISRNGRGKAPAPAPRSRSLDDGFSTTYTVDQRSKMPRVMTDRTKELALIKYCTDRMQLSRQERDMRYNRCSAIDVQLNGFTVLDKDDRARFNDTLTKGKVKPVDHNLPIADAQLDDCTAYLMSVFAPDMNVFESAAPAGKAQQAKALTNEINKQGQRAQYYSEFARVCDDALRYNFAAATCYWEREKGFVFKGGNSGTLDKSVGIAWQGNAIQACDVYNFFYDINVHPVDLPRKGEWFSEVELVSPFRMQKDEQDGKAFGVGRFYNSKDAKVLTTKISYFREPPIVRKDVSTTTAGGPGAAQDNWQLALRSGDGGPAVASMPMVERIRYVTWLVPADHGLSTSKDMELWALHICQANFITLAVKLDNTHGMLPIACAAPIKNALGNSQRTYAERLLPLQHFDSFLLNTHQAGVRKSLYGMTVYDSRAFPGLDLSKEDLTSAVIAMKSNGLNLDIDKMFRHYNTSPGTEKNVDMIEKIDAIMQKILPTDVYRQVADLERATLYQAAATVQTGNRRSLKIARIISNQCFETLKMMMVYNIYANQQAIDYIDEKGVASKVNPAQFVELGLETYISNGLKGIDRLMIITAFKEVLAMILQSQQAIAEIDIVKLLAYFFNLAGEPIDLNEFRKPINQRVVDSTLAGQLPVGEAAPEPAAQAA